jgi:hypothetical protein
MRVSCSSQLPAHVLSGSPCVRTITRGRTQYWSHPNVLQLPATLVFLAKSTAAELLQGGSGKGRHTGGSHLCREDRAAIGMVGGAFSVALFLFALKELVVFSLA